MLNESAKKSVLAGMLIAFGGLFSAASAEYGNVVQGLCFSVGLLGVLLCGARLFTGQVLMVQDVWDGKVGAAELLCRWAQTWALNFVGAAAVSATAYAGGFVSVGAAVAKAALPSTILFYRAILCNVMVCMAVRCYRRSDESPASAAFSTLLPVACFVACGFEHSVADMLYMTMGAMNGAVGIGALARVICVATLGNVVGGSLFAWLVGGRVSSEGVGDGQES